MLHRVLLNWFRRQRRPVILSMLLIVVYELWRFDAVGDDLQPHGLADDRSHKFPSFLLSDKDSQAERRYHGNKVIAADGGEVENANRAAAKKRDDPESEIMVNTTGPVVNPHPFNYVINCPDLCRGADVFVLNYVHTGVDHFQQRARIRQTWALQTHYRNYSRGTIRTVFFMGLSDKAPWLQEALEYEASLYKDIVQEDFLDTYRNLSYKGVAALKWISTYCSQAAYIMKCDDDVFVNMFSLLKHLNDMYEHNFRRRLIVCMVWWRMHVLREGKWGIPKEDVPDNLYPVYCSGMGFVLTTDSAIAMYRVSFYVKFMWVDDAYISGYLPRALGGAVNHTDMGRAYCGALEMSIYSHETEWYKYIFTHVHDEDLYRRTWDKLVEIASRKTIPSPAVVRPGLLADEYIAKRILFPELEKKRIERLKRKKMREKKEKEAKEKEKKEKENQSKGR